MITWLCSHFCHCIYYTSETGALELLAAVWFFAIVAFCTFAWFGLFGLFGSFGSFASFDSFGSLGSSGSFGSSGISASVSSDIGGETSTTNSGLVIEGGQDDVRLKPETNVHFEIFEDFQLIFL